MAVSNFNVTYTTIRANRFPHLRDFDADTVPTASAVSGMIDRAAAQLEGKLGLESIVPSSIDGDTAAFFWCQETLELLVAIRVAEVAMGQDRGLLQVWRDEVKQRWVDLDVGGAAALGSGAVSTSSSDPDGPTSHISENGLTTDASADMSTTVPRLRRDDQL